jgi:cytochrome c oxidase assembly protein subunit 15
MTTATHDERPPDAVAAPAATPSRDDKAVAIWLLICCAMIFAMAVIGAVTRLTESGLSIMEWAPFSGALPPLSEAEWQRVFALYQQIPEYQEINRGMSLDEFRSIFWLEYVHRLWGRLIGVVFLVPLVWFWLRRRLRPGLPRQLWGIFALGALQGFMGWYMVASGFAERTDVSQYRLVAHLLLACAIYVYTLIIALRLLLPVRPEAGGGRTSGLRLGLIGLVVLLVVTIASGGFVAGLNAGFIYNTFPLMDGRLVPADYDALSPWSANLFENVAAVQFNHRVLAIATLIAALVLWIGSWTAPLSAFARRMMALLAAVAGLQVALGISTLLLVVPVWLGALHQAGALTLLTVAVCALHGLPRAPRP